MAALGHNYNAIVLAVIVVVLQQRADMVDIDLAVRNQDNMSAAGNPGSIGDPPGIAPHHFHNDHAIMRVRRGVDAVDCLCGNRNRSVEAERYIGATDVIVNGLGNPYAGNAVLAQKQRNRLRVVAPERDQGIDLVELQNLLHLLDPTRNLLHVGAGRMKNGAALQLDAIRAFESERNPTVVKYAPPAIEKSDELVAVGLNSFSNGSVDHRIQAGAIAATGQQSNSHANSPDRIGPAPEGRPGVTPWMRNTPTSVVGPATLTSVLRVCKAES